MKKPVIIGVLGMTDAEFSDFYQTGKWPQRDITPPVEPKGLTLGGLQPYDDHDRKTSPSEIGKAILDINATWEERVRNEGRREVRVELARKGGRRSGAVRKAGRPWVPHATELALIAYSKYNNLSDEKIATAISDCWKLEETDHPGHRTLTKHVAELRATGTLPQRSGPLRK
jgi:hypothetical protein